MDPPELIEVQTGSRLGEDEIVRLNDIYGRGQGAQWDVIAMPKSALFLDRDGVINVDHGYVVEIEKFQFVPGIFDLTRFAADELQWPIIVVTNQSGIGRGLFTEEAYRVITEWMCDQFVAADSPLMRVYHSPHHPLYGVGPYRQDHPWRKPNPGMFLQAAADYGIDLKSSVVVGDALGDMEAGSAAGIGLLIRIDPDAPKNEQAAPAHHVVRDLSEALSFLRGRLGKPIPSGGAIRQALTITALPAPLSTIIHTALSRCASTQLATGRQVWQGNFDTSAIGADALILENGTGLTATGYSSAPNILYSLETAGRNTKKA